MPEDNRVKAGIAMEILQTLGGGGGLVRYSVDRLVGPDRTIWAGWTSKSARERTLDVVTSPFAIATSSIVRPTTRPSLTSLTPRGIVLSESTSDHDKSISRHTIRTVFADDTCRLGADLLHPSS